MMKPGRRQLILGGAALGAGLLVYWQSDLRSVGLQEKLLRAVGGKTTLRKPDATGIIDEELGTKLWLLFQRTGARWHLWKSVSLNQQAFARIIDEKTMQEPSYLTEYREAGQVLDELGPDWQQDDSSFDQLFRLPTNIYGFHATRLGRMQKYVIGEFIELLVAFGGFKAFGYHNYRGFAGGLLSDQINPPYRSL